MDQESFASEAKGHKFESCRAHHLPTENPNKIEYLADPPPMVADCQLRQKFTELGQNSDKAGIAATRFLKTRSAIDRRPFRAKDRHTVIPLGNGVFAHASAEDFEIVSAYRWYRKFDSDGRASVLSTSGKHIPLHRLIMGFPAGQVIDHIDGDTLNNRRSNLRICSSANNVRNAKVSSKSSTGYKGVRYAKGKYYARIVPHGKPISLGVFDRAEDAARAYDQAAKVHYGEFARLNFPERRNRRIIPVDAERLNDATRN